MNDNRKMQLSDLRMQTPDGVDWKTLDGFFNTDAPNTLAQSLLLTNVIKTTRIMEYPQVDSSLILKYLTGMADDTITLNNELSIMREDYNRNKQIHQGNYNEDAHMYSLTVGYAMSEWVSKYEETVAQNLNDVVDYINSIVPQEHAIVVPVTPLTSN